MLEINVKTHISPKGHSFYPMDSLYRDSLGFRKSVNAAVEWAQQHKVEAILAIEGRGFILASTMAYLLGLPLIPARKAGKLPADKMHMETPLGTMEIHRDGLWEGQRVLVVDAVLNIEHSLEGAIKLARQAKAEVVAVLCLQDHQNTHVNMEGISFPVHVLFDHAPVELQEESAAGTNSHLQERVFRLKGKGDVSIHKVEFSKSNLPRELLLEKLKRSIRTIPDFPKKGIQFRDVTTIMQNPEMFRTAIYLFLQRYESKKVDAILGIESRGFIFGAPLAYSLGVPFIPVSKKGKTPGKTLSIEYEIEYGTDEIEIPEDALSPGQKVLVIDDLIATGGTAYGSCQLVSMLEANVEEVACVIELPDLHGRERVGGKLFTLVEFLGE